MDAEPASPHSPLPLLKALLRCASITPEEAGALSVLEAVLGQLGFTVTRHRFEGDGSYPVDNLFATRGTGGRHLLFAGHTDVVPPGDIAAWTRDPFGAEEIDGIIYGRGAVDMKSGVAAFVAAAEQAIATGAADHGTLSLAITNDEEADSVNGTAKLMTWAASEGLKFDFAIVGEPSSARSLGDSIKIGRRGSLSLRIGIAGTQGHVAYPERANNPLPVLAAVVTALTATPVDAGTPHFQPSNLEVTSIDVGNDTGNLIPARGQLRLNIRFNDLWTPETLERWVGERLAAVHLRGCTLSIERNGPPSHAFLSPQGEDVELLAQVIAEATGRSPERSTGGGTSDARFIAPFCPVVECGLVGTTMHQVDERVPAAEVEQLAAIYAAFIARFLAAPIAAG